MGTEALNGWKEGSDLINNFGLNSAKTGKSKLARLIPNASKEVLELLSRMLSLNPSNRPSIEEVLKHSFFKPAASKRSQSFQNPKPQINESKLNETENKASLRRSNSKAQDHDERKMISKNIVKNLFKEKIEKLNSLDLSKVNETDRESSMDASPKHVVLPKLGTGKKRFQSRFAELSIPMLKLPVQVNHNNQVHAEKIPVDLLSINAEHIASKENNRPDSGLSSIRSVSKSQSQPFSSLSMREIYENKKSIIQNETQSLAKSKRPASSMSHIGSGTHDESSNDELDTLSREMNRFATKPNSMKNIPNFQSKQDSQDKPFVFGAIQLR